MEGEPQQRLKFAGDGFKQLVWEPAVCFKKSLSQIRAKPLSTARLNQPFTKLKAQLMFVKVPTKKLKKNKVKMSKLQGLNTKINLLIRKIKSIYFVVPIF